MIKSKKLKKLKELVMVFLKKVVNQKGIYKSLNCGLGSNDKKDDYGRNISIIMLY